MQGSMQTTSSYESLVIARYVGSKVVRKVNYFEEVKKSNDLSKAIGGRVYTFEIKRLVCETRSRKMGGAASKAIQLSFFNQDGSGFFQPYEANKEYLIYLSALPNQKKLKEDYELEEKALYYSPYPFEGKEGTQPRVREISTKVDDNYLAKLKKECREKKY